MPFAPVDPHPDFSKLEKEIIDKWDKDKCFEKSVERDAPNGEWSFYDGPPFATGLPHYGHLLAGTMKDVIPRYWTMRGYRVRRIWGWDCHGLPVEYGVEKEMGISGKKDIEEMGVDKFNDACRASVLKYADDWRDMVRRMGRWVDFDNCYRTMDADYMESIWWIVKQLWEKDLLYKGHRSMHVCPRCETPLSNFEVTQNYKDVTDQSVIVSFPLKDEPDLSILAWTTTPWTLPGNVLLAVNPDAKYAEVKISGDRCIVATELVEKVFKGMEYEVLNDDIGIQNYIGKKYKPLFPYYEDTQNAFRIVEADFVTLEDGTGVVHIAPAFGEDDAAVGKKEDLPLVQHVVMGGTFKDEVIDFAGMNIFNKETTAAILLYLRTNERLLSAKSYDHSYPHCWRCDSPLMNYATEAWYVKVERMRDSLAHTNEQITWVPEHLKHGRFGKWLENARDWNISRNRYWGAPIPIWECECGEKEVIGSRQELLDHSNDEKLSVKDGKYFYGNEELDLHKHIVDKIELKCSQCDKPMYRIPEVLDCWFESGSMPYAQMKYPFENKEEFERGYPADFIAEGVDQTRGWFYTLHVLANALEIKDLPTPAFKNVIVNGMILAEDGQKMSKSKKNFPDPSLIIDKYGADALRLAFMMSPAVKAEDLRFSDKVVEEALKTVNLPIWNALVFFTTYASASKYEPSPLPEKLDNELDRWIVAALNDLNKQLTLAYETYDLQGVSRPFADFLDGLNNWYIRRSRKRFAPSHDEADRLQALATLEHCLGELAKLIAPVIPFLAEIVWESLDRDGSVHLAEWPLVNEPRRDENLVNNVSVLRGIVKLGHAVRSREKLPVRQPLAKATIGLPSTLAQEDIMKAANVIMGELNVQEVIFEAPDEIATRTVTPNPRVLGKKLGAAVQDVIQAARVGDFTINDDESVIIKGHHLTGEEVSLGYVGRDGQAVESDGGLVVALDTEMTPELEKLGMQRQLKRAINEQRKNSGLKVGQIAKLSIYAPGLEDLLNDQEVVDELKNTLSLSGVELLSEKPANCEEVSLGDKDLFMQISLD